MDNTLPPWTMTDGTPYEPTPDAHGFTYRLDLLTVDSEKRFYIGKKQVRGYRMLAPLRGKKRRRRKVIETDWISYLSSSPIVTKLLDEGGKLISRTVLSEHMDQTSLNVDEFLTIVGHAGDESMLNYRLELQTNVASWARVMEARVGDGA